MKTKYLLGFFAAISMTQSALATTFIIADMTGKVNSVINGTYKRDKSNIEIMTPLYKEGKASAQNVTLLKYKLKSVGTSFANYELYGITGITPLGLTHLRGVGFVTKDSNGQAVYKAEFDEDDIPSRTAVNVLIEIQKTNDGNYEARLYQDRLFSREYKTIPFVCVKKE